MGCSRCRIPAQPSLAAGIYAALTSGTSFSLTLVCGVGILPMTVFNWESASSNSFTEAKLDGASMRIMARLSRFARARPAAVTASSGVGKDSGGYVREKCVSAPP